MIDKTTITISSLITIGLVTLGMLTPAFFDKDKYYCETRQDLGLKQCTEILPYYGISNGKCVLESETSKLCRTGWLKVTNDMKLPDETINNEEKQKSILISNTIGKQYICDNLGCIKIS